MSFRIFNSQKNDTISDYINKQCTKENMNIQKILYKLSDDDNPVEDYDDTCYKIGLCSASESIKDYNILQKYNTFYNNNELDSSKNKIVYFNGKINQSNYLKCDLSGMCLVQQLKDPNELSYNNIHPYDSASTTNNLLLIDMSGVVFYPDPDCINLFNKNNENVKYQIDECNNIVTDIDSELNLCINEIVKDIPDTHGWTVFNI